MPSAGNGHQAHLSDAEAILLSDFVHNGGGTPTVFSISESRSAILGQFFNRQRNARLQGLWLLVDCVDRLLFLFLLILSAISRKRSSSTPVRCRGYFAQRFHSQWRRHSNGLQHLRVQVGHPQEILQQTAQCQTSGSMVAGRLCRSLAVPFSPHPQGHQQEAFVKRTCPMQRLFR